MWSFRLHWGHFLLAHYTHALYTICVIRSLSHLMCIFKQGLPHFGSESHSGRSKSTLHVFFVPFHRPWCELHGLLVRFVLHFCSRFPHEACCILSLINSSTASCVPETKVKYYFANHQQTHVLFQADTDYTKIVASAKNNRNTVKYWESIVTLQRPFIP